jgi:hypothetical protein
MRYGEAPIMMISGPYPPQSETQWGITDPTVFYDGPTAEQALDTHRRFEQFPSRWITSTDSFMEDPFHDASGHPLKAHQDEVTDNREHIDSMEIPRDPSVAIIVPANGLPRDDTLCRGECLVWWTEYKSVTEQINNLPTTTKLFYLKLRPDDHEDVIGRIARCSM